MVEIIGQLGLLTLAASLLAIVGGLLASILRLSSPIAFALATNLIAWAILVALTLALSPVHEVRSATTWAWLVAVVGVALAAWWLAGRPRPSTGGMRQAVVEALGDTLVRVLAVTSAIAVAYITVLTVATPENEGDALAYHVARAAFWRQHHGLSYIANAIESRLNVNPPNAEIGVLFTMLTSGTQRFVGLVQLSALIVCLLAAIGIARRIGAGPAGAAWAGLLVVTLPVITTQAPTAQNDLVVAAFLATSAFFVLGEDRPAVPLAGLALALAIGTKFTAVLSVPVLLLLALVAAPSRRRWVRAASLAISGVAAGSVWYLVNLVETGHLDGGLAQRASQTPSSLHQALTTLGRFGLDSFDLSGLSDWGWAGLLGINAFLYWAVGFAIIVAGLSSILRHGRSPNAVRVCASGALVVVTPGVVDLAYRGLFWLAPAHVAGLTNSPNTTAGATPSWYGPLGVLGVAAGIGMVCRAVRAHDAQWTTLVLAATPVLLIGWFAFTLVWDPWRGRFFIFAYVLAAASWHLILPERWLSWTVTAVACVTTFAVLANTLAKPSGLRHLDNPTKSAVWGRPDWVVQSILRPGGADRAVLRFAERQIPPDASLALAAGGNDFLSPFFGPDLTRHVDLVLDGHAIDPRAGWLIAAPGVRPIICALDWRIVRRPVRGWLVARRAASRRCSKLHRLAG